MDGNNLNLYWKAVVDTIQDGVMIVDPDGKIVSVNRGFEEITGYMRQEVIGKSCAILNCNSCEIAREIGRLPLVRHVQTRPAEQTKNAF